MALANAKKVSMLLSGNPKVCSFSEMFFFLLCLVVFQRMATVNAHEYKKHRFPVLSWLTEKDRCLISKPNQWTIKLQLANLSSVLILDMQSKKDWVLATVSRKKVQSYNFVCLENSSSFDEKRTSLANKIKKRQLFMKRVSREDKQIKCRFRLPFNKITQDLPKSYRFGISIHKNLTHGSEKHWFMHTTWLSFKPCIMYLTKWIDRKTPFTLFTNVSSLGTLNVTVSSSPKYVLQEGSKLNLSCSGKLPQNTKVAWYKDNRPLTTDSSVLRFGVVNRTTAGIYKCSVKDGNRTHTSFPFGLRVTHMDSPIISSSRKLDLKNGAVLLECYGDAFPKASCVWIKDGAILARGRKLFISDLDTNSSGTYYCQLRNKYLTKTSQGVVLRTITNLKSLEVLDIERQLLANQSKEEKDELTFLENTILLRSTGFNLRDASASGKGALVLIIVLVVELLGLAIFIPMLLAIHKADLAQGKSDSYDSLDENEEDVPETKRDTKTTIVDSESDIFYVIRSKNVSLSQLV